MHAHLHASGKGALHVSISYALIARPMLGRPRSAWTTRGDEGMSTEHVEWDVMLLHRYLQVDNPEDLLAMVLNTAEDAAAAA